MQQKRTTLARWLSNAGYETIEPMEFYFNGISHKSTRDWIERSTGIYMKPPAKRNGNSQHDHLQADVLRNKETGRPMANNCKIQREMTLQYMRENGEITGRPKKQAQVEAWQLANPGGTKMECHKATGISRPTIDRWWQ